MNSSVSVLNDSIIVSYCMMMVVGERYRKASTALLDIFYVENVLIQKISLPLRRATWPPQPRLQPLAWPEPLVRPVLRLVLV